MSFNIRGPGPYKAGSEPEPAEVIIHRHEDAQRSRDRQAKESRDAKRKLARAKCIDITGWEKYWQALDEWKTILAGRALDRELCQNGWAPSPPASPVNRPRRPEGLEDIGSAS
jgi:hypothetical protein